MTERKIIKLRGGEMGMHTTLHIFCDHWNPATHPSHTRRHPYPLRIIFRTEKNRRRRSGKWIKERCLPIQRRKSGPGIESKNGQKRILSLKSHCVR
jgi:hypothetical protein